MKLIVGLGNPGMRYWHTRHNAGFFALDLFAKSEKLRWKKKKEWRSEVAQTTINGIPVLLVKPQTYMNASGDAVQIIVHDERIEAKDILIVQDDLDIQPGRFQFKFGGGAAGHNGIKDIYHKLKTEELCRMRIGIGRPPTKEIAQDVWVLKKISPKSLPTPIDITAGMRDWIEYGYEYCANKWNGSKNSL